MMDHIDVTKKKLSEIEVKGRLALFTDLRVDKETVPDGMYCYALRHGDDFGIPCSIEEKVAVNYFGAILTTEPFDFENRRYIEVKYEDFAFTGEHLNIRQFKEKMERMKAGEIFEYQGFHYQPVRSFNRQERDMSLKEISAYLCDTKDTAIGRAGYDYDKFYSGFRAKYGRDTTADIFLCLETGKEYIPCENSLMEYTREQVVQKGKAR